MAGDICFSYNKIIDDDYLIDNVNDLDKYLIFDYC
jgi:hypothetical protein